MLLNETINGIIDNILSMVVELAYAGPNNMDMIKSANMNKPKENIAPNTAANFVSFLMNMMFVSLSFLSTFLLMKGYNA